MINHCRRHLLHLRSDRALLLNTFVLPAFSAFLMVALFKEMVRAAQGGEISYLPLTIMLVFSGQAMNCPASAAALVRERNAGFVDRIRTTPGGQWPYYLGMGAAIWLRLMAAGLSVSGAMAIIGLRASLSAWIWLLIVAAVGAALTTAIALAISVSVGTPEETMAITPLFMAWMFLSAGLVPADRFVSLVRPIVRHNPLTHAIEAGMALDAGAPAGMDMMLTLIWLGGVTVLALGVLVARTTARAPRPSPRADARGTIEV